MNFQQAPFGPHGAEHRISATWAGDQGDGWFCERTGSAFASHWQNSQLVCHLQGSRCSQSSGSDCSLGFSKNKSSVGSAVYSSSCFPTNSTVSESQRSALTAELQGTRPNTCSRRKWGRQQSKMGECLGSVVSWPCTYELGDLGSAT